MTSPQNRTKPHADGPDPDVVPSGFHCARDAIRSGIAKAREAGATDAATLAALMAETLPRLVNAYGPARAAIILAGLSHDIGRGIAPNCRPQ